MVIIGCPTGGAAGNTCGSDLSVIQGWISDNCCVWELMSENEEEGECTSLRAIDEGSKETLTERGCRGGCSTGKWVKERVEAIEELEIISVEVQDWVTEEKSEQDTYEKEFSSKITWLEMYTRPKEWKHWYPLCWEL